jgi:hypothetical protein
MKSPFVTSLARARRRWQAGLLAQVALRLIGWALVVCAGYAVLDYFVALETETRVFLNAAIAAALAVCAVWWSANIVRFGNRDMARAADEAAKNPRRAVLAAFELQPSISEAREHDTLADFLVEQSVDRAAGELRKLSPRQQWPLPAIFRQSKFFSIQLAGAAVAIAAIWPGARIIAERLAHPWRDVPPYSALTFSVTPGEPRVFYGGDASIGVEIGGAPVTSQVWLLTRSEGRAHKTACFQERPQRFAQRLEKITHPVEFCFATGNARSRWHKVALLLQPRVAMAGVTITPPAYSRLPRQSFLAGGAPISALQNSVVNLSVTSNRPLLDGTLTIRAADGAEPGRAVAGAKTGPQTVSFTWTMTANAELDVAIRDVQGAPNSDPFKLRQKIVPDNPPQVAITEPPGFALATPSSALPLAGYAEDDLGLGRVEIVRAVVGYRDRAKKLGPDAPERRLEFNTRLDMKTLGVEPGQVIELYLEASDLNPSLMGHAASDVVRVQVISDAEYAKMIRERTTIEEFAKRFEAMGAALAQLIQTLHELRDAADTGSDAEKAAKLKRAVDQAAQSAELFEKMANDFPAFDVENKLKDAAAGIAKKIRAGEQQLRGAVSSDPQLSQLAADAIESLGGSVSEMERQQAGAREIAAVARVMECAATFQKILRDQALLTRELGRFEGASPERDMRLLEALGRSQEDVRRALQTLIDDLNRRAQELPGAYAELRASALEFAQVLEGKQIPADMSGAVNAAQNQNGRDASKFASIALEKLQQMLSQCHGSFPGMCQGGMKFSVSDPLKETLEQMMQAIAARIGSGGAGGIGAGTGVGGNADDGYATGGHSPLNVPVFGPDRLSFTSPNAAGSTQGRNTSSSASAARVNESGKMQPGEPAKIQSESVPLQDVPEKYREAVKRYFSEGNEGAAKDGSKSHAPNAAK